MAANTVFVVDPSKPSYIVHLRMFIEFYFFRFRPSTSSTGIVRRYWGRSPQLAFVVVRCIWCSFPHHVDHQYFPVLGHDLRLRPNRNNRKRTEYH